MAGWAISFGIGAVTGIILGVVYKLCNGWENQDDYFNDSSIYQYPKNDEESVPIQPNSGNPYAPQQLQPAKPTPY
jgi:hypothetical protein